MKNLLVLSLFVSLSFDFVGCNSTNIKIDDQNNRSMSIETNSSDLRNPIMNTDKFEEFMPGWRTNGYIYTNNCLIQTNYKITSKVIK